MCSHDSVHSQPLGICFFFTTILYFLVSNTRMSRSFWLPLTFCFVACRYLKCRLRSSVSPHGNVGPHPPQLRNPSSLRSRLPPDNIQPQHAHNISVLCSLKVASCTSMSVVVTAIVVLTPSLILHEIPEPNIALDTTPYTCVIDATNPGMK